MLKNNLLALGITLLIALAWLRLNDFFAHKGWVASSVSRKIIHIGTGPIFVLCWLLFNDAPIARYLAAIVPLGITLQFAMVGTGIIKDPSAVEAMSRTGDRREILRGPLFYGLAFVALTILFWRESPVGIVALMVLCGGDGLADIVGQQMESAALPWSAKKTVAGSVTMLLGGFILALGIIGVYVWQGVFPGPFTQYILPVGSIAVVTALIESLPFADIDNLTVPLISVLMGLFLF
jgi:phytol kinase